MSGGEDQSQSTHVPRVKTALDWKGVAFFDYDALDKPAEKLRELIPSAELTQAQADEVMKHASVLGELLELALVERIMLWLGGGEPKQGLDRMFAVRAAILVRYFAPCAKNSLGEAAIAKVWGVSRPRVIQLLKDMERQVLRPNDFTE